MALSLEEQMELQDGIDADLMTLKTTTDFEAQLDIQDRMENAIRKLVGYIVKKAKTLYDRLVAGEFLKENVVRFTNILKKVWQEMGAPQDINPLRQPCRDYLSYHDKGNGVFESAYMDDFLYAGLGRSQPQYAKPSRAASNDHMSILAAMPEQRKPATAVRIKPKTSSIGDDILIDIDTEFESPDTFREIIRAIENDRECDTVVLKINSHGGRTDSAQAVYAALLETKAKTVARVITAYSSGSIVAMSCDEIQTTPHCTMMIHNASAGAWGKIGDMKTQTTFLENYFKSWFDELYAGFMTSEEIDDVFKGQDFWLNETDIKRRLPNWRPIRQRRAAEAQANNERL